MDYRIDFPKGDIDKWILVRRFISEDAYSCEIMHVYRSDGEWLSFDSCVFGEITDLHPVGASEHSHAGKIHVDKVTAILTIQTWVKMLEVINQYIVDANMRHRRQSEEMRVIESKHEVENKEAIKAHEIEFDELVATLNQ